MSFKSDDDSKKDAPRRRIIRRRQPASISAKDTESEHAQEEALKDSPGTLPVLPLRDVTVFNYMIVPLMVGRESSARAVEMAAQGSRYIFLVTQKTEKIEDPGINDLYTVGSVATLLRVLKMPDGHLKALVQGVCRAKFANMTNEGPCPMANIEILHEQPANIPEAEQEALVRFAREQCERILAMRGIPTTEIMSVLTNVNEPGRIADLIASNLRLKLEDAQAILACIDPIERLHLVVAHLVHEAEVASMQMRIQSSAKEGMDKAQKEYYLREQLKAIRTELGEDDSEED